MKMINAQGYLETRLAIVEEASISGNQNDQGSIVGFVFATLNLCLEVTTTLEINSFSDVLRCVGVDSCHFDIAFHGVDFAQNSAVAEHHVFGGLGVRDAGKGDVALRDHIAGGHGFLGSGLNKLFAFFGSSIPHGNAVA